MKEKKSLWDLWKQNWEGAYKFFNSKGNVNTRSKLKTKWNKVKDRFKEALEINKKLGLKNGN